MEIRCGEVARPYVRKSLVKCSQVLDWDNCRSTVVGGCGELHLTHLCHEGKQRANTGWTTELKLPALDYVLEHLLCRPPWC